MGSGAEGAVSALQDGFGALLVPGQVVGRLQVGIVELWHRLARKILLLRGTPSISLGVVQQLVLIQGDGAVLEKRPY